jgi:hypothetical protein
MSTQTTSTPAPRALTGLGAVQPWVKNAAEVLAGRVGITGVHGWRATSDYDVGGHPAGLAVDFPATPAQGNALVAYAIANAAPLAIKYVIWQQRIWYPGKGWTAMADRGSPSANHQDHVHVSFTPVPGVGTVSNWLTDGWDNVTGTLTDAWGNLTGAAGQALTPLNPFAGWEPKALKLLYTGTFIAAGSALVIAGAVRLVMPGVSSGVRGLP